MLKVYSIEVPARENHDLEEEPIVVRLRKVRQARIPFRQVHVGLTNTHGRQAVRATTVYDRSLRYVPFIVICGIPVAPIDPFSPSSPFGMQRCRTAFNTQR